MSIAVPDNFKTFVSRGVASGRFRSEEDAISGGLSLLRERERKLEALRADIQMGLEKLDAGQSTALDIDDIQRRGRLRLASSGKADCRT